MEVDTSSQDRKNEAVVSLDSHVLPNGQATEKSDQEKEQNVQSALNTDVNAIVDKETIDLEEKRRRECLGNMEKIEREFADLKEKFFRRKNRSLKERTRNDKKWYTPRIYEKV